MCLSGHRHKLAPSWKVLLCPDELFPYLRAVGSKVAERSDGCSIEGQNGGRGERPGGGRKERDRAKATVLQTGKRRTHGSCSERGIRETHLREQERLTHRLIIPEVNVWNL